MEKDTLKECMEEVRAIEEAIKEDMARRKAKLTATEVIMKHRDMMKHWQEYSTGIENYLKLRIKPKPSWLPNFIWQWLLNKILVLSLFKN